MALKLEYVPSSYEENDGTIVNHLVCKVSAGGKNNFTSLGLEEGQKELTPKQRAWLDKHWVEIEPILQQVEAIVSPSTDKNYQRLISLQFKYLDRFCKECKIRDS